MTLKSLLLTALLLCLLSAATSYPHYALSIPAKLNSGEIGKACMNLKDYNKNLQLNVVLQYGELNTIIFNENVSAPTYFKCNDFQIPVVQDDVPVLVLLSVTGEGVQIKDRYTVVISVLQNIYLVQMDKPTYKPGQKVLFNLVSINQQLLPINELYSTIYLTDPMGARLIQWQDQTTKNGIVSLDFFLVDDSPTGSYSITAQRASGNAVVQYFTVQDYVLPRFDVTLNAPSTLSVLDETMKFNASAMYTYGEPVPGTITIQWCRTPTYGRVNNCYKDKNGVCFKKKGNLTSAGTYNGVIDLTYIQMELSGATTYLNLSITVTEAGTGIQVMKTQYLWVTSQLANINFEQMNQFYKRGIPYSVRVVLQDENGLPMVGEEVDIQIDGSWDTKKAITGVDGAAIYVIDTSNFLQPNFTIRASYLNADQCYTPNWQGLDYPTTQHTVFRFYSETGSFVQIIPIEGILKCGQNQKIAVQYLLSTDGVGVRTTQATFYYLAMSRARIALSGQIEVEITPGVNGTFSFDLPVTSDIAFSAKLMVYTILQEELIADTRPLNIEKCFRNDVSLNFSKDIGPPASNVDLLIKASPESLCAVKVIDSSLLLLGQDNSLTPETVYYSLQDWYSGYHIGQFNVEQSGPTCEDPNQQIFYSGNYYVPVSSSSEGDTYNNVKNLGLIVGTDVTVRKPVVCGQPEVIHPRIYAEKLEAAAVATSFASTLGSNIIETIRKNFSDTWVWTTVSTNSSGRGIISQKAPDSITDWKGSMICTSKKDGFGMTKDLSTFTTFQPFFVEMTLPYSFIRGETLILSASVSNYLVQCVKVQVNLLQSNSFVAKLKDGKQGACICTGGRAYYTWSINATLLGVINFTMSAQTTFIGKKCDGHNDPSQPQRKDTVIQSIIVESEGIKKEVTSSNLICLQGPHPKNVSLPMKLAQPSNMVLGSASGFITVLGDIVSLPLQNLQYLLQTPYGCGEQNLARMAPIPSLLEYLKSTGQLTDKILQKGIQIMNTGYYRELSYRLWSGAYSLFGGLNGEENSWLTAYVFKTFEQCKKYIYIDKTIQQQALIYLQNSQKLDSGCFRASGAPFMRWGGGTDDDISFTASLAITLLESNYSIGMTLLDGTLTCLQNALNTNQSVYNQALMVYVFTLAKDWDRRCQLLKKLRPKAISEEGMIHWEREDRPSTPRVDFFYPPYRTADIEITAYMLMSIAKGPNVTQGEMTFMAQVAVWLIKEQNSYGGFQSTKDTVVALQALSTYAKLTYNPNAHHNILLSGLNNQTQIMVDKKNRLLVQRLKLSVPGNYSISISGTGCCLVQTTVRYNIPVPRENSAFLVSANTSSKSCVDGVAYTFPIGISVSYRGKRNETNIVIIDVTMLSGYQADDWSIQELMNAKVISKYVKNNNHLMLYINSVSSKTTYLSFNVIMSSRVLNVKTASIYVYDIYETDENGYASYHHPCAQ